MRAAEQPKCKEVSSSIVFPTCLYRQGFARIYHLLKISWGNAESRKLNPAASTFSPTQYTYKQRVHSLWIKHFTSNSSSSSQTGKLCFPLTAEISLFLSFLGFTSKVTFLRAASQIQRGSGELQSIPTGFSQFQCLLIKPALQAVFPALDMLPQIITCPFLRLL